MARCRPAAGSAPTSASTGQKAEPIIEDDSYATAFRKLVRAQGGRAGADLGMFALFAESVDYARARLAEAAPAHRPGLQLGDIARELGITRQAAVEAVPAQT